MGSNINTSSADRGVLDVTLVLDTNPYVSGDVLAVAQEVTNAFKEPGGTRNLMSVHVLDEDDQAQGFDLVFLDATATLGTINEPVSITDADARKIIGVVQVASGDYVDFVGCQTATKTGLDLMLKAAATSSSLWIGAVSRGTGTYTASGIKLKLGFA